MIFIGPVFSSATQNPLTINTIQLQRSWTQPWCVSPFLSSLLSSVPWYASAQLCSAIASADMSFVSLPGGENTSARNLACLESFPILDFLWAQWCANHSRLASGVCGILNCSSQKWRSLEMVGKGRTRKFRCLTRQTTRPSVTHQIFWPLSTDYRLTLQVCWVRLNCRLISTSGCLICACGSH